VSRIFKPKSSTVHEKFGEETVILNLESGSYYSAQGTASTVWELVADGASEAAILNSIKSEFSGDGEEIARSTTSFLDELVAESLVETETAPGGGDVNQTNGAAGEPGKAFSAPLLQRYTDMEELLQLDPIHEVDDLGWPNARKPAD